MPKKIVHTHAQAHRYTRIHSYLYKMKRDVHKITEHKFLNRKERRNRKKKPLCGDDVDHFARTKFSFERLFQMTVLSYQG